MMGKEFESDFTDLRMMAAAIFLIPGDLAGQSGPLPADAIWNDTVMATWMDADVTLQLMDDVEDRAAQMLADWDTARGPRRVVIAA